MTIYVACSANEPYIPRIRPYLESLERHLKGAPITPVLVAVDTAPRWELPVMCVSQDTAALPYAPPLSHLQAGGFLDALPGGDDDVIVFTDGDIVMQRPPTAVEVAWLKDWPADAVGLGYNSGPGETLMDEAQRLGPRAELHANVALAPCYNTGVVVARRAMWRRWFKATAAIWPMVEPAFHHYAKQQWAMCMSRAMLDLPVVLLPQTIHTHGCYALPHGCHMDEGGRLCYLGTPVLFRHHI
jgi:hypothetical protein